MMSREEQRADVFRDRFWDADSEWKSVETSRGNKGKMTEGNGCILVMPNNHEGEDWCYDRNISERS